ncbi:MAG: thiamine phosphate synthase [Candidatus Eremiobacteraeota bacterium]|nr:thiamine phosphate synthase [Candidatus Eremiobacteraeota bacterium]
MARVSAAAHRLRGIYAIVDGAAADPVNLTRELLDAQIGIIQYRAKSGIDAEVAHSLREMTYARDALFILNDDWRAVDRFDADGVHLGPDDAARHELPAIRRQLRGRILGLSCGNEGEARFAEEAGADYIGVGCIFRTTSKSDAGAPIGISGLKRVAAATSLPVAAIGGIDVKHIVQVKESGVAMAALLSAFSASDDPRAVARELVARWSR